MKKITSLLMAVVLLATMLSVFAVPASAEDAPTEITPIGGSINITANGNYIINSDCTVNGFGLARTCKNVTLTIATGVTVTVTNNFSWSSPYCDKATLNVYGTLDISAVTNKGNSGTINVFGCSGGKIEGGQISGSGSVTTYEHIFVDGVCSVCNTPCKHKWDAATGKCTVCGLVCTHKYDECDICGKVHETAENTNLGTGSTLSEGSLAIITAIVGLAVGFLAAMFIFKKKKKLALAEGVEKTDEE